MKIVPFLHKLLAVLALLALVMVVYLLWARQANIEFVLYLATALILLGAVGLILLRPLTWYRWLAGLAAGAAWLITWYAPVSIWIGAALALLVFGVLVSAARGVAHS